MTTKSKRSRLPTIILLSILVLLLLSFVTSWKQNYDFTLAIKNYPNATELKSNTVYSQNGINIGVGNFKSSYLGISVTDDMDNKYFKSSTAKVGDVIEDTKYKISIRALSGNKVLLELENLN
jgi:hypothetical protein